MLHLWLEHGVLSTSQFQQIQKCVDSLVVPSDVGRISQKIEGGFSGFTADQFFYIPSLYGVLTGQHLECWRCFVLACRILCNCSFSIDDITLADVLLIQFCKRVQDLYGESGVTPNMHMLGHLKDAILDYGPIHSFWLYSFEWYNGILGNQPNNRLIESQLMQRFLHDNVAYCLLFPEQFKEDLNYICTPDSIVAGSVSIRYL